MMGKSQIKSHSQIIWQNDLNHYAKSQITSPNHKSNHDVNSRKKIPFNRIKCIYQQIKSHFIQKLPWKQSITLQRSYPSSQVTKICYLVKSQITEIQIKSNQRFPSIFTQIKSLHVIQSWFQSHHDFDFAHHWPLVPKGFFHSWSKDTAKELVTRVCLKNSHLHRGDGISLGKASVGNSTS